MWQWIKSNIIEPVTDFFSGIVTKIRNWITDNHQYQPIPNDDSHSNIAEAPIALSIPIQPHEEQKSTDDKNRLTIQKQKVFSSEKKRQKSRHG